MAPREVTLVTGASAGIGKELATIAAEKGKDLVLVARRAETLEALGRALTDRHGVRVEVLPLDLEASEAPERLARALAERRLDVHTLINNAGYGNLGAFHESEPEVLLGMVRLNVMALTHLTRLFLPSMVEKGRGRVLNVASTAGFEPGPLMAVYYATKAYVVSFSEALAEELRGTGVTVTALCPGPVLTEFQSRAGMENSNLFRLGATPPRPVAEAGYRAMERGRVMVVPGLLNKLGELAVKVSPRAWVRPVVKRINQTTG